MIGFLVFCVTVIIGRIILLKEFKKLSESNKSELASSIPNLKKNLITLIPFVALLLAIGFTIKSNIANANIISLVLLLAIFAYFIVLNILKFKKIKEINLPKSYTNAYLISQGLIILGVVAIIFFNVSQALVIK